MDITSDNLHSTLYQVCRKVGVPDYVASAECITKEAVAGLPDTLFADRSNRRYPIDTKANTWLSAVYFAKTAEADGYHNGVLKEYVEGVIKLAADKYGIRADVDRAMEEIRRVPAVKKAEDDESNYGWPSERKYPMFDERGVKLACSYFDENAYKYPKDMRHTIAKNIFLKCAEYGISPSDRVRQEAGSGFNLLDAIGSELVDRAHSCPDAKARAALAKTASAVIQADPSKRKALMDKFANVLEKFDEAFGFDKLYGKRFNPPSAIFYGRSVKEAKALADDTVVLGDKPFSIKKLASLPISVFTDALGDDFGKRVKTAEAIDEAKLADELHSMPTPDKKALFRSILNYVG